MALEIISRPVEWFHPDPTQPRKEFDMEALRQLGQSMLAQGQRVPGLVKGDGTIIDMHRRWMAAPLVGMKTLFAIVVDGLSDAEVKEIQLVIPLQTALLKPYEMYLGCSAWMKANPGATAKDLAARIGKNAGHVSRILSLDGCVPEVHDSAKTGLLGISAWSAISKVDAQRQHQMLEARLNGSNRHELEEQGRKVRSGPKKAKLKKVKIPYPGGEVIVTGKSLGMEDVARVLETLAGEARASVGTWDLDTFVSMQRHKQKGGA
jgi:ParB family transcriptional regulator, chromosome partitioning protein